MKTRVGILKFLNKIPGGIVVVPTILASLITTFAPGFYELGGLTSAIFNTSNVDFIVAMLMFIAGTQFAVSDLLPGLKRGGILCGSRLLIGIIIQILLVKFVGMDGIFGISTMAIVCVMVAANPAIYIAVTSEHGEALDMPVFGVLNIVTIPAVPLVMLGVSAGVGFDWWTVISMLIIFGLGMLCGNLDDEFKGLFGAATPVLLFFMGCAVGSTVNWIDMFAQAGRGLILVILYLGISLPILLFVDKVILKRPGYAAVSMTSITGNSIVAPTMICAALPALAPYLADATAQIAFAMAITNVMTPFLCSFAMKKWGTPR